MPRPTRFSPEVRARAVRMVMEHEAAHDSQWAAIRQRLKQLERENFELRRANEILKKASAYFAQAELDRRAK
jgi:transposase